MRTKVVALKMSNNFYKANQGEKERRHNYTRIRNKGGITTNPTGIKGKLGIITGNLMPINSATLMKGTNSFI